MTNKILSDTLVRGLTQASKVMGRDKDVNITFSGDNAYTDGSTINLPAVPSGVMLDVKTARTMRGYADHEAGHIRHTDIPNGQAWLAKHKDNSTLVGLMQQLEDVRIERKIKSDYLGSKVNLDTLNSIVQDGWLESVGADQMEGQEAIGAIFGEENNRNGLAKADELLEGVGEKYAAHSKEWVDAVGHCRTSRDVQRLAEHIYEQLEQDPNLDQQPEPIPQDAVQGDDGDDEMEAEGQAKKDQEEHEAKEGKGKPEGKPEEGEAEVAVTGHGSSLQDESVKEIIQAETEERERSLDGPAPTVTPLTTEEDTWSSKNNRTNKQHGFQHADQEGLGEYQVAQSKASGSIGVLRSKILRYLKAKEMRDWDGGREVGRLDTRRLVSAYNGQHNVFKVKTERDEVDTAISILADLSGSMSGERADVTRDCLVALAEALETTSFSYSINGFCETGLVKGYVSDNSYPENTRVCELQTVSFKAWNERLFDNKHVLGSFPSFVGGANNDPESILLMADDLMKRPEKRKVLIVLSDGEPSYAVVNQTDYNVGHTATKEAVRLTESMGIDTIGIGIQSRAVEHYYSNNFVVNDLNDLTSKAMDTILKLATS